MKLLAKKGPFHPTAIQAILTVMISLILQNSTCAQNQSPIGVSIAQVDSMGKSGRRFLAGSTGFPVYVIIANQSKEEKRVWQTWNSWGAGMIELEITDTEGGILGVVKNMQKTWTINAPTFNTLPPTDQLIIPIAANKQSAWKLVGKKLEELKKEEWHTVRMRAKFTSRDAEGKGVWNGSVISKFYDFEFRSKRDFHATSDELHRSP